MKPKIHPEYGKTTITCACGAVYHVGSTKKNIKVEVCAKCHPFFTGVQKIVDTTGRVERFMKKYGYTTGDVEAKGKPEGAGEGKGEALVQTKASTEGKARAGSEAGGKVEALGKEKAGAKVGAEAKNGVEDKTKVKKAKTGAKAGKAED